MRKQTNPRRLIYIVCLNDKPCTNVPVYLDRPTASKAVRRYWRNLCAHISVTRRRLEGHYMTIEEREIDEGAPTLLDRIYVVTPDLQDRADLEGWCISLSDRNGWNVERDDEANKLPHDDAAHDLARAAGVPLDHRGRLTKFPVHFRDLEGFK